VHKKGTQFDWVEKIPKKETNDEKKGETRKEKSGGQSRFETETGPEDRSGVSEAWVKKKEVQNDSCPGAKVARPGCGEREGKSFAPWGGGGKENKWIK